MEGNAIDRLIKFAEWCKKVGYCKSRLGFESMCGLSRNYLYNTKINSKGNVGAEHLAKIYKVFPMLSPRWVITGEGDMIEDSELKEAYKKLEQKYDKLKKKYNELKETYGILESENDKMESKIDKLESDKVKLENWLKGLKDMLGEI